MVRVLCSGKICPSYMMPAYNKVYTSQNANEMCQIKKNVIAHRVNDYTRNSILKKKQHLVLYVYRKSFFDCIKYAAIRLELCLDRHIILL